jgi:hypothetical protein
MKVEREGGRTKEGQKVQEQEEGEKKKSVYATNLINHYITFLLIYRYINSFINRTRVCVVIRLCMCAQVKGPEKEGESSQEGQSRKRQKSEKKKNEGEKDGYRRPLFLLNPQRPQNQRDDRRRRDEDKE